MKLWLLKLDQEFEGYEIVDGIVVRAETEKRARQVASQNRLASQDEQDCYGTPNKENWLDSDKTTCELIGIAHHDNEKVVILHCRYG